MRPQDELDDVKLGQLYNSCTKKPMAQSDSACRLQIDADLVDKSMIGSKMTIKYSKHRDDDTGTMTEIRPQCIGVLSKIDSLTAMFLAYTYDSP